MVVYKFTHTQPARVSTRLQAVKDGTRCSDEVTPSSYIQPFRLYMTVMIIVYMFHLIG